MLANKMDILTGILQSIYDVHDLISKYVQKFLGE